MLIHFVEVMPIVFFIEVYFVKLIDHLSDKRAVLHIIKCSLKNLSNQIATRVLLGVHRKVLKFFEKLIYKVKKLITSYAFRVVCPIAPSKFLRNRRMIPWVNHFLIFLRIIYNFQEEHPDKLRESLSITINTRVFAHDVLDIFYGSLK